MKHSVRPMFTLLLLLSVLLPSVTLAQSPVPQITPPGPPETGPGSPASYIYPGARIQHYGEPGTGFWLVEPTSDAAGSTPVAADPLPVILHFNGCCGDGGYTTPDELTMWFTHLARQGHVIVAPVYADYGPGAILETSVAYFEDAQEELAKPGHTPIDLDRLAVTGFSYGSPAALEYTATAEANGWPVPKAYFAMGPCVGRFCYDAPEVTSLPEGLKAVVMAFDIDDTVGVEWPQRLYAQLMSLPESDRAYIELHSDDHGWPALLATHGTPVDDATWGSPADYYTTVESPNALDTWGVWKVASGLFDCAFSGENCEYALGNGDALTNMGAWSDGAPVRPLTVATDPIADWALPAAPVAASATEFAAADTEFDRIGSVAFPQHMTFGPDGRFYVIDGSANQIKVFDSTTWERGDPIGRSGDGPGEFQFHPVDAPFFGYGDLVFSTDGSLYVADTFNNRVQIFDANFEPIGEFGADVTERGMLLAPGAIALDEANNRLFVASASGGAVNVYTLDGEFIERWGVDGPGGSYFSQPNDVLLAPDGSVYVVDQGRSRVYRFASDGTPIEVFGGNGLEAGILAEPHAIEMDAAGNLYITESNVVGYGGTRIQIFSPDGEVIGIIPGPGEGRTFASPVATTIGPDGAIYVADEQANAIYRFLPGSLP